MSTHKLPNSDFLLRKAADLTVLKEQLERRGLDKLAQQTAELVLAYIEGTNDQYHLEARRLKEKLTDSAGIGSTRRK